MIRLLISFFFLFSTLQADWDQLFPQHEDPTVAHHVNVISGHLSFSLIDTVIQGPTPLPITRTYSSSGALERTSDKQDSRYLHCKSTPWSKEAGVFCRICIFLSTGNTPKKHAKLT